MEKLIWAFIVGGGICVIGQIMMDVFRLTPAHTTCTLVVVGAVLGGFGWYEMLIKVAGAGATVPISSFGNSLVKGVVEEASQHGFIGVLIGTFKVTSSGVSAAIVFAFIASMVFRPKG